MIIDCISDLHGYYPELEGGDLLIVAGDLTTSDKEIQYKQFYQWLEDQNYKKIIYIGGNHDNYLQKIVMTGLKTNIEYLFDSGSEFEGLKIWSSPWTKTFEGMNPHCKAFTVDTEEELAEKFEKIPYDIDILITRSAPFGIMDKIQDRDRIGLSNPPSILYKHVGSKSLSNKIDQMKDSLKLCVLGGVHEGYGEGDFGEIKFVNASHVNENYEPVNKPIRIIL